MVRESSCCWSDSVGSTFYVATIYLGGLAFGRGYGHAEISGDNGLGGTVKVRFDQQTNLKYLTGYQVYSLTVALRGIPAIALMTVCR